MTDLQTEAHFAACLLHVGPHRYHICEVNGTACPININYHNAVYNFYLTQVRQYTVHDGHDFKSPPPNFGWTRWWNAYIEWVGDSPEHDPIHVKAYWEGQTRL